MTDRMLADLRMYRTLVSYVDGTPTPSLSRPGLITGTNLLRTEVMKIGVASGLQGANTTGSTKDRRTSFNSLCSEIFEVGSGVRGYAGNLKNYTLFNQFKSTEHEVELIGFDHIGDYTDAMILLVNPLVAALSVDWGVDAPKMLLLSNALATYRTEESLPRHAITGRKTQTDLLPAMFTEARRIIKEIMLPAAVTLRSTYGTWYTNFLNSAKIVDYPSGTTVVEGFLLDAANHGIYNGNIFFPSQNITVKSLFDGSYHAAHFPHGVAAPVASADTFNPQTAAAFEVKQGSTVHHNFNMIHV